MKAEDAEVVNMYGLSCVNKWGTSSLSTQEATLTYWGDGTICVNVGNRMRNYKRYNYNTIYGDNIPSGYKIYRCYQYYEPGRNSKQDDYLLVSNDKNTIREVTYMDFGYYGGGWQFLHYTEYITVAGPHHPKYNPSPSPGINPTPSPSPTPKVDHGRTCAGCRGTGVCTMCQGKGGYYTNSGTYTGSGSKTWHTCSSCGGSGRCGVCYGKGVIE